MAENKFKELAHALVDNLSDVADWKELATEATLAQDIEEGLSDSEAGNLTDNDEVLRMYEGGQ